ncbi:hypothetical protein [Mycobacterium cookii]|nr:hypothetical protein [Mycobacterium cookii]MCV7329364.1 hypothetical protein [Mycobacterium cookii]
MADVSVNERSGQSITTATTLEARPEVCPLRDFARRDGEGISAADGLA